MMSEGQEIVLCACVAWVIIGAAVFVTLHVRRVLRMQRLLRRLDPRPRDAAEEGGT